MTEPVVPGGDVAADSVEEMAQRLADEKVRSTLGEYEKQLADMMAKAEQAFAAQQHQLNLQSQSLQAQITATRQQAGPPEAVVVSASLAQRVKSIADAHPDLPKAHFAGVLDQAARLDEAVQATAKGDADTSEPERLANSVISFFERVHPRVSSKFLEGAGAAVEEAERILEKLPELAPVAGAIAAAV